MGQRGRREARKRAYAGWMAGFEARRRLRPSCVARRLAKTTGNRPGGQAPPLTQMSRAAAAGGARSGGGRAAHEGPSYEEGTDEQSDGRDARPARRGEGGKLALSTRCEVGAGHTGRHEARVEQGGGVGGCCAQGGRGSGASQRLQPVRTRVDALAAARRGGKPDPRPSLVSATSSLLTSNGTSIMPPPPRRKN